MCVWGGGGGEGEANKLSSQQFPSGQSLQSANCYSCGMLASLNGFGSILSQYFMLAHCNKTSDIQPRVRAVTGPTEVLW